MGYNTDFTGELKFATELTASQLAKVASFCGADVREHEEWIDTKGMCYIDLEMLDDFSGIRWNGGENTYRMVDVVNMITANIRRSWPDFRLTGILAAQGEDFEDRWHLRMGLDGVAYQQELVVSGERITCPHCEESFVWESDNKEKS